MACYKGFDRTLAGAGRQDPSRHCHPSYPRHSLTPCLKPGVGRSAAAIDTTDRTRTRTHAPNTITTHVPHSKLARAQATPRATRTCTRDELTHTPAHDRVSSRQPPVSQPHPDRPHSRACAPSLKLPCVGGASTACAGSGGASIFCNITPMPNRGSVVCLCAMCVGVRATREYFCFCLYITFDESQ